VKDNYELFHKILLKFHLSGILENVILIGSWVLPVYKRYFNDSPEIPILRTSDIDFLIPNPPKIGKKIDIPKLLGEFEFEEQFSLLGNHTKFVHPDLEVEFLIPEIGRKRNKSVMISEYKVTAQPLRYLYFIQDHTLKVNYSFVQLIVPEPTVFVLLKFLLTIKRKNKAKVDKDISTAVELSDFLLKLPDQIEKFEKMYSEMPKTWQKKLLNIIEGKSPELFEILSKK
jgi:Nucleotidyltransferase